MVGDSILSAIGQTPIVRLAKVFKNLHFQLYAKLESFNPGGSMKDRSALSMLQHGLETGRIRPDSVIIESSSGNMGIGLAQACSYFGLRFICVVDPKTTVQNIHLLHAYGAEVDHVVEPHPETGEFLQARIDRVEYLLRTIANSFSPDQYSNLWNPRAHYTTMDEIIAEIGPGVDYLFCAASTCGTVRGCSERLRSLGLPTRVIAVDAVGSVIFGGRKQKRLIPGHGAAVRPKLYQPGMIADCVYVTDLDCVIGCRRLARHEAILAGGSSGAVLAAVERYAGNIPRGATCVAIFADRGERYLDTIYSDAWVNENFGEVAGLWNELAEVKHA